MLLLVASVLILSLASLTDGHGRLIEPPGRSTMWRYGYNTEHNTNDHQLSCGGFGAQFYRNKGKCGICGDPYQGPRDNEAGGLYAKGIIVRKYKKGDIITVKTEITVNHLGWFEFRLCPNNNPKKAATEECLDKHLLKQPSGDTRYHMPVGNGVMAVQLQLPAELTCTQCVLQWKWNTASNIGFDGKEWCRGCGNQEQFYGCADVSISASGSSSSGGYKPPQQHIPDPAVTSGSSSGGKIDTGNKPPQSHIPAVTSGSSSGGKIDTGNIPPQSHIPAVTSGSSSGGKIDTGNKPPQSHIPAPVTNRPQQVPVNNNNNLPGAFVPLHNSNNQGLPHGLIEIPVDKSSDSCKARDFWREKFVAADEWCRQNCKIGLCPKEYCEDSCQKR